MSTKRETGGIQLAFGSCNRQNLPQMFWESIAKTQPTHFLWTGDSVYNFNRTEAGLAAAFDMQINNKNYTDFLHQLQSQQEASSTSACPNPRNEVVDALPPPVFGAWDDHDMGVNDGGNSVPIASRRERRHLYQRFLAQSSASSGLSAGGFRTRATSHSAGDSCEKGLDSTCSACTDRGGDGDEAEVYRSYVLPSTDRTHAIRFIILDTRFHRDDHLISSVGSSNHPVYPYLPLSALVAAAVRGISSSVNLRDVQQLTLGRSYTEGTPTDAGSAAVDKSNLSTSSSSSSTLSSSSSSSSSSSPSSYGSKDSDRPHYMHDGFEGDILGEKQWAWLEDTLRRSSTSNTIAGNEPSNPTGVPVLFNVLVSSVQVLTTNPVVESWGHFPASKARLLGLLAAHAPPGLVLLSGDVHHAELSAATHKVYLNKGNSFSSASAEASNQSYSRTIVEVTSSGLTHTCADSLITNAICPIMLENWYNKEEITLNPSAGSDVPPGSGHRLRENAYHIGKNFGTISTRRCHEHNGTRGRGSGEVISDNVVDAAAAVPAFCMDVSVHTLDTESVVLQHTVQSSVGAPSPVDLLRTAEMGEGDHKLLRSYDDWEYEISLPADHNLEPRTGMAEGCCMELLASNSGGTNDGVCDVRYRVHFAEFPVFPPRFMSSVGAAVFIVGTLGGLILMRLLRKRQ